MTRGAARRTATDLARWFGEHRKGADQPALIIAEAGVNHNGDSDLACRLIDAAVESKADAVKFQTFRTDSLASPASATAEYQKQRGGGESQAAMLRRLELSDDEFRSLARYAEHQGIVFLSTPFDTGSVDLLDQIGVPAFKISSGEITNIPLLRHVARKKRPVLLSTGMADLGEIDAAARTLLGGGVPDLVLLHCVSRYPAPADDVNLRAIETLRCAFRLPVGFSDHTLGIAIPIAAAALGACVIEKHITLDRQLPGPDHAASLEPDQFRAMVEGIREVEQARGTGIKRPSPDEEAMKAAARKSLTALRPIPKGSIITEEALAVRRPGTGIEPRWADAVIGRRAAVTIEPGAVIAWEMIE